MRTTPVKTAWLLAMSALWLLTGTAAHAQTLYQVEIVVFARDSAEAENEEHGDNPRALRYPERIVALQNGDGSNAPFQLLPGDALQLNKEAAIVGQRRNWRLLAHAGWRQYAEEPGRATSVFIAGGRQFGAHRELEGSFTLSVEHFLRADANLWLSRFGTGGDPVTLPNPPAAPEAATATANTATSQPLAATQVIQLQEQRRMRSGELHYFDHPRLGLLVLATPVTSAATTP